MRSKVQHSRAFIIVAAKHSGGKSALQAREMRAFWMQQLKQRMAAPKGSHQKSKKSCKKRNTDYLEKDFQSGWLSDTDCDK